MKSITFKLYPIHELESNLDIIVSELYEPGYILIAGTLPAKNTNKVYS